MVLGWPPSKLCPVIPTSNQDAHQAKNRKKGGLNFNHQSLVAIGPVVSQKKIKM
jgi:hypothetical protein